MYSKDILSKVQKLKLKDIEKKINFNEKTKSKEEQNILSCCDYIINTYN